MPREALFATTGVLWCARSVASFSDPAINPESGWDWFAVVSYSVALVALALALPSFARLVGHRIPTGIALVTSAGAVVGGVGNLLEDGLQLSWAGDWVYFPGVALVGLGLVALTVTVAAYGDGAARLLAAVPGATLIGFNLLERGGGILVLAAWFAVAVVAHRADASPRSSATQERSAT